jgi:transposase
LSFYRVNFLIPFRQALTQSGFPLEALRKLKATVSAREGLKKESVKLQNRIKALKIVAQTTNISTVLKVLETQLGYVKEGIKELESELKAIIKTSEELGKTYDLITSVLGVGLITASNIIVESENFTKITNPRKFACHSGIAPFPYSSGSSVRGASRTSHFCKKSLKGVLFKAAATAIQHDPQLNGRFVFTNYSLLFTYNSNNPSGKSKIIVFLSVCIKWINSNRSGIKTSLLPN